MLTFPDARKEFYTFNTEHNTALEIADENIRAGNALWEYLVDVLGTGAALQENQSENGENVCASNTAAGMCRR